MLSKQDGPGSIGVVLIVTFRLLPEHQVCSTLLFVLRFYCYAFANIAFYNGCIASRLKHSNKTIVKSKVSQHIAITPVTNKAMLRKQDGPGAIWVALIATFRLLPEHPVCSTLPFSTV